MIDSLIILGGGTSGLISALMLRSAYPELKITMIESSALGIIGVGEGSTEHWKRFMKQANISVFDMMRETGSTFKMGIKFTNWHGDGTHYFHSLAEQYGLHSTENGLPYVMLKLIADGYDPLETVWKKSQESVHVEPLHENFAQYHFDTFKLNDYFHRLCRERNVDIIDATIKDVVLDEAGYVKHLVGEDNKEYPADFFIDCSGFRRIIGTKLGAKWIDKVDQLPMNSALAFPTPYTEQIPSYTEATALSSGWVWRIPTQERYGNGYVFCDDFIDETTAYDEVSEHYKKLGIADSIEIGRKVKFGAGHVDQFWIKNCVMTGLSGIFVEPLEATSMGTTIQQTFLLTPGLYLYERGEEISAKTYNDQMKDISENIIDFIQLHYFTQRNDSEFWKWVSNEMKLTDFNKEKLDYMKRQGVHPHFFMDDMLLFHHLNWMQVMHGLRLFKGDGLSERWKALEATYGFIVNKRIFEENVYYEKTHQFTPHREALELIKQRYENVQYKF